MHWKTTSNGVMVPGAGMGNHKVWEKKYDLNWILKVFDLVKKSMLVKTYMEKWHWKPIACNLTNA